jgi:predicted dehydrogenase
MDNKKWDAANFKGATMKAPDLRFGLVGCGRIAVRHAELLGQGHIQGGKLVAVCDVKLDRAMKFSEQQRVPYFLDMDEMMSQEEIDVVVVLTPSGLHAEHVINLAKYRKHIVVEKPMALSLSDADAMIHKCDEQGIKLFVVKQNRWNLPVQKLKEALVAGRFGRLTLGTIRVRWCRRQDYYDQDSWRGTWAYDGGVIANQASHHIDLLEWLMGPVESVVAKGKTSLVKTETEDTAIGLLKFRSGALGIIEATTATRPADIEGSVSILGEKGTVEIAGFAVNQIRTWQFEGQIEVDKETVDRFSVNPPNVYGFGHKAYLEHVVDCVRHSKAALVDGLEGRKSLELISAMYESMETGREVFLRFIPQRCRLGQK